MGSCGQSREKGNQKHGREVQGTGEKSNSPEGLWWGARVTEKGNSSDANKTFKVHGGEGGKLDQTLMKSLGRSQFKKTTVGVAPTPQRGWEERDNGKKQGTREKFQVRGNGCAGQKE